MDTELLLLNSCLASMSAKIQSALVLVSDIVDRTELPPSLEEQRELLGMLEELGDATGLVEDADEVAQRVLTITDGVEDLCAEALEAAREEEEAASRAPRNRVLLRWMFRLAVLAVRAKARVQAEYDLNRGGKRAKRLVEEFDEMFVKH